MNSNLRQPSATASNVSGWLGLAGSPHLLIRLLPGNDARARLPAGCREEGRVLVRRDVLCEKLVEFTFYWKHGASATRKNLCHN